MPYFIYRRFLLVIKLIHYNGRSGRLLITLFLHDQKLLKSPLLYISLFFKKHRQLYYENLDIVRHTGDWEKWLNFFFDAVTETANDARNTLVKIKFAFDASEAEIPKTGKARLSIIKVFNEFKNELLLTISEITKRTGMVKSTAGTAINNLMSLRIINNSSDKK